MSIFRSAIEGEDGEVDAGYLSLFWVMTVVLGAVPVLLLIALIGVGHDNVAAVLQATGIAIGAACTGLGVSVGAVGAFRAGDRPRSATTTTVKKETVTTDGPSIAAEADSSAAAPGVEPLRPKIGQDDVGKSVALVKPKRKRQKR